jgi:hypothetical protein
MVLQTLFHQCLVFPGQPWVIEFRGAANQQLPFGNSQSGQFRQYFAKAHAKM